MIKLIFMLKRKPGITKEQFRDYYENNHVKLAKRNIGHLLIRYIRNYPNFACMNPTDAPTGTPYEFEYDVITEMHIKDEAALAEIQQVMNGPETHAAIVEDELKFMDRKQVLLLSCEEVDTGNGAELALKKSA